MAILSRQERFWGTVPYADNSVQRIRLPRENYLDVVHLNLQGVLNVNLGAGAAAVAADAPWNLLQRIDVVAGSTTIFSMTGFDLMTSNMADHRVQADSQIAVANGNNTITADLLINLSRYTKDKEPLGILPAFELPSLDLVITWGSATNLATLTGGATAGVTAASTQLNVQLHEILPTVQLNTALIYLQLQNQFNLTQTGDNAIDLDRLNVYLGFLATVFNNGARTGSPLVQSIRLVQNGTYTPVSWAAPILTAQMKRDYQLSLPIGVFNVDLDRKRDQRSALKSLGLSSLKLIFNTQAPTAPAYVRLTSQMLAVKPARW